MRNKIKAQAKEALKKERRVIDVILSLDSEKRLFQHYQRLLQAEKRVVYCRSIIAQLEENDLFPNDVDTFRKIVIQIIGEHYTGLNIFEQYYDTSFNLVLLEKYPNHFLKLDAKGDRVLVGSPFEYGGLTVPDILEDFSPFSRELNLILEVKREVESGTYLKRLVN